MNDFSDEEIEQFEQELEDTSVKSLLIEQNALLRDMHALMLQAVGTERDAVESEPQYECVRCNTQHPESELRQHAEREHNAPSDLDLSALFEQV